MRNIPFLTVVLVLGLASLAMACPNCRDTIANTAASDDVPALPAAFNYSIYGMLLGLIGVIGFVGRTIYKGVQSADAASAARRG
jgi:hypothetical protein